MLEPEAVSIPLEQGSVFRRNRPNEYLNNKPSQSLWNRAVSFDNFSAKLLTSAFRVSIPLEQGSVFRLSKLSCFFNTIKSQSLWNRAVSFDCSGILKPCGTRLTRATSQLFPRLRELGLDLIKCCTSFNILFTYQAVENGRDFTRVFRFY